MSELIWPVHVHILIEVMDIIPFHWQTLGELLTIGLLFFCSELGQSYGMLAEVVWCISSMSRVHVVVVGLKPVILLDPFQQLLYQPRTDTEEEGGRTLPLRYAKD